MSLYLGNDSNDSRFEGTQSSMSRTAFLASLIALPSVAIAASDSIQSSTSLASIIQTPSTIQAAAIIQGAQTTSALEESISGFFAGASLVVTKTIVKYPMDTAAVRLQMTNSTYSIFDIPMLFNDSYRGVVPPLLANIPGGAVFFAVKDASKALLTSSFPTVPRSLITVAAVAAAQIPYWLIRNPSEIVKTRQQAKIEGYTGINVTVIDAYKKCIDDANIQNFENNITQTKFESTFNTFYNGYIENILYAYPADVLKFVIYEQITNGKKNLPPIEGAISGAIATSLAQLITTPLDVVRHRTMVNSNNNKDKQETSLSYIDNLIKLGKDEGISGLFAGVTPRIGKSILSGAIQFATYEETKQKIANSFSKK